MRKELLVYNCQSKTAVEYLFENEGDETAVPCAFPVVFSIQLNHLDFQNKNSNEYQCVPYPDHATCPYQWVRALTLGDFGSYEEAQKKFTDNDFNRKYKASDLTKRQGMTFAEWSKTWKTLTPNDGGLSFNIRQDGAALAPDSVYLESVVQNEKLVFTFHFTFKLHFKAEKYSNISAHYTAPDFVEHSTHDWGPHYYEWRYLTSSASSWKGAIDTLCLLLPSDYKHRLPSAFRQAGSYQGYDVFLATNYEPAPNDELFSETILGFDGKIIYGINGTGDSRIRSVTLSDKPFQTFVKIDAKPDARQITTDSVILKWHGSPQYNPSGLWREVFVGSGRTSSGSNEKIPNSLDSYEELIKTVLRDPNSALSLFDGITETAFVCQSANASLTFETTQPIDALLIANGYHSLFKDFSRAKTVEIQAETGTEPLVRSFALKDRKHFQLIDSLFLPAGRYKLTVVDTFAGEEHSQIALSEIYFLPKSNCPLIQNDPFYSAFHLPYYLSDVHRLNPLYDFNDYKESQTNNDSPALERMNNARLTELIETPPQHKFYFYVWATVIGLVAVAFAVGAFYFINKR